MGSAGELWRKLTFFLRRNHYQRELREEMELHLALKREELNNDDAARRRFGNSTLIVEDSRDAWGWRWLDNATQDLSYGFRQLRRNPGIACIAILTLALGIGVNSAIFSIFNSILLRPMAVPNPDQIAVLGLEQKKSALQTNFSYPDFEDIRRQSGEVFSGLVAYKFGMEGLSVNGQGGLMWTNFVSGDFFSTLGVQPALGRLILPSEDGATPSNPVLVLGYAYWQTRFGADPHVVGRQVSVDGHPFTIAGVVPKDFHGVGVLLDTQGYIPIGMSTVMGSAKDYLQDRSDREFSIAARLKPGVTVEQGGAALRVIASRLAAQYPKTEDGLVLRLFLERYARPGPDSQGTMVTIALLFQLLSALVLVVACINVANILLVRATVRQREMAVRAALGAARRRLIRQLLTESLLLAALGGIGGVLLALWSSSALSSIQLPTEIPFLLDFHFDWIVFLFASVVAAFTGALVGIMPALRVARGDLATILHGSSRSVSGGRQMLRSALVVAQLSGSLALLIVGALFIRSFVNAQHTNLGFDPDNTVLLTLDPNQVGYDEARGREFYRKLLDRVSALPGVQSASLGFSTPMGYFNASSPVEVPGYQPTSGTSMPVIPYNLISPGYFDTMRIRLVSGRSFTDSDKKESQHVAVINESMAERFWPHENPIGRQFRSMDDDKHPIAVVGVVQNSRVTKLTGKIDPTYYVPFDQSYVSLRTLHVRTSLPQELMLAELRKEIGNLAPGISVAAGQTMRQSLDSLNGLLRFRLGAGIAAGLGGLALVLAIIGLYGVVSYAAAQRTREIGIRVALGAASREILGMVVGQGLKIVGIGLLVGVAAALTLSRLVGNFLVGVSATDPLIYAAVTALLAFVGAVACAIPAHRATHVDPVRALRVE